MRLSPKSLLAIETIINGEAPRGQGERLSPYRTLGEITSFFRAFGERDIHPRSGAPSRSSYTSEKLEKFNGTEDMSRIICNALDFWGEQNLSPEHAAAHINTFLRRDGFEIIVEERYVGMRGDEELTEPYFVVRSLRPKVLHTPSLIKLSEESISEHVAKARAKIESGDHAGAISNAYTLIEGMLKELLRRQGVTFNENEGDIRALYKVCAPGLNLQPKGENLESYLKIILEGLQKQVSGLYEVPNKGSDRHARRYNPARHHAKLAVNSAFALCEFLLDSHDYQSKRKKQSA